MINLCKLKSLFHTVNFLNQRSPSFLKTLCSKSDKALLLQLKECFENCLCGNLNLTKKDVLQLNKYHHMTNPRAFSFKCERFLRVYDQPGSDHVTRK